MPFLQSIWTPFDNYSCYLTRTTMCQVLNKSDSLVATSTMTLALTSGDMTFYCTSAAMHNYVLASQDFSSRQPQVLHHQQRGPLEATKCERVMNCFPTTTIVQTSMVYSPSYTTGSRRFLPTGNAAGVLKVTTARKQSIEHTLRFLSLTSIMNLCSQSLASLAQGDHPLAAVIHSSKQIRQQLRC